jgi:hypothetical protein
MDIPFDEVFEHVRWVAMVVTLSHIASLLRYTVAYDTIYCWVSVW